MKLAAITAGVLLAAAANPARAQVASAASEAQRLLQGAANPGDFADLTANGLTSLKHKPSGLVCLFGPESRGNSLRASPGGLICETASASEIDTLDAFHMAKASEDDVQEAVGRAMGPFKGAQPASGFADLKSDRPSAPPHVSRRFFAASGGGEQLFVRVAYSQVGDWFVLQRVISTVSSAQAADADGERRLLAVIGQVMDRQAQGAAGP
ncbi:MAG: hypothetical protein ACXU82_01400 [Caulobacteraceae bacterium]